MCTLSNDLIDVQCNDFFSIICRSIPMAATVYPLNSKTPKKSSPKNGGHVKISDAAMGNIILFVTNERNSHFKSFFFCLLKVLLPSVLPLRTNFREI